MILSYSHEIICLVADNSSLHAVPEIPAAEANVEAEGTSGNEPLLGDNVPVAEVTAHELEANSLLLAGLEVDLLETSELADGSALGGGGGKLDVQLGNGGTGDLSGVGDGGVDGVDGFPESGVAAGDDGQVLGLGGNGVDGCGAADTGGVEGGVGETEAELVADGNVLGVEVAVVDLELLIEPGLPVVDAGGVDGGGGRGVVVGAVESDGVGELSGGVDLAVKDVDNAVARLLAREVGSDDGSDVGVVSEGKEVDARRVGNNDRVVAGSSDGCDNVVTVPVDVERLAISSLLGPGLQENEADFRLFGNPERPDIGVGEESVVQPVLDKSAVLLSLLLDGNKRSDEVCSAASARSTTGDESTELVVLLVEQTLGGLSSIVTEDSDGLGCLEGKHVVLVLQKGGGSGTVLANVLAVVFADISARGTGEVPVTEPSVDRAESVKPSSRGVDSREVLVLAEVVVRCHLANDHVIDPGLGNSAVVDHLSDVAAKVRANAGGSTVVAETSGHVHIETSLDRGNARMNCTPVGHDVALETKLSLQDAVLSLGVLASV